MSNFDAKGLKARNAILTKRFGDLGAIVYSVSDRGRQVDVVKLKVPGSISERRIADMFSDFTKNNPVIHVKAAGEKAENFIQYQWDGSDFTLKSKPAP